VHIDVRRWGARVALLGALVIGRTVRAEPVAAAAQAKAPDAATKADARQRFDQGVHLFERGENAAALAEFKRAYDLIPNLLVLYNIGLVYAAMDRPVDAVDALDKVLDGTTGAGVAASPTGLTASQAAKARQVRADQAARIAEVMVVTDKPAVLEVDGVEAGRTPLERPLRLASGAHVLSALAPGCLPARRELTLAGRTNQTLTLALLPTESSNAHLTLTVPVPGAEVLVNGQRVGTTPLPASVAVAPGAATIEVRRAGYRVATRTIQVDEGSNGSLRFDLEEDPTTAAALKGRLIVTPSEPGAVVSVDGLLRPEALQGLDLPGGPHELRVERAGYLPFERQVEVGAGTSTSLVAALVATAETRAASDEGAHVRHVWGASSIAAGLAIAGGSAIYAIATRNDLSSAQATLNAQLAQEKDANPTVTCSKANPDYAALNCPAIESYDQNAVDSAKLKRDLAYGGIGLGVVVAGVGTYLFATGRRDLNADTSGTHVGFWSGGQSGGLIFSGGF